MIPPESKEYPDFETLSKIAWPLECAAAHGKDNPTCTLIGQQEIGRSVYEFYVDKDRCYWFKEYYRDDNGIPVPHEEYFFGPIRRKAKANRERMENALDPEQKARRQKDLAVLRKHLKK